MKTVNNPVGTEPEKTRVFDWGIMYFTQSDYPMMIHAPKIVLAPSGLPIVALQEERTPRHYPEDKRKHEFCTLVPGVFEKELDELSHGAELIHELSLGPRGMGRKKILVRYVEKTEKMEVIQALKESGYKGRFYFWK